MDGKEEWPIFHMIKIKAVCTASEVKRPNKSSFVGEYCPIYEIDSLGVLWRGTSLARAIPKEYRTHLRGVCTPPITEAAYPHATAISSVFPKTLPGLKRHEFDHR